MRKCLITRLLLASTLWLLGLARPLSAETYPVFIEQDLSKTSLYVGEQTLYNYTLNTQTSVFNYQPPEFSLAHVWSEVIAVNQRYRRTIDGELWTAYSTRRAIYPLAPGELIIPDLSIPIGIQIRSRRKVPAPFDFGDAFSDDFLEQFFSEVEPKTIQIKSRGAVITVKPLPPAPATLPEGPNGYIPVGATSLSARTSRDQLGVGETVTLEVDLVSTGNLNPITELNLRLPAGIRVYPEQAKNIQNENNAALIMRKTFRYGLVPISPGSFLLPPIKIPFFDPETGSYRVAETPAFTLQVAGNALENSAAVTQPETPQPTVAAATPSPTPGSDPQIAAEDSIIGNVISSETIILAISVFAALIALLTGGLLLRRRRRPLKQFSDAVKSSRTTAELSELYRSFLIKRLTNRDQLYTYEEFTVLVKRARLSPELEYLILNLLDAFEQARFAPGYDESLELPRLKSETLRIASGILTGKAQAVRSAERQGR